MIKKIIIIGLFLTLASTASANFFEDIKSIFSKEQQIEQIEELKIENNLGTALRVFRSSQVGTSPTTNYVLQTDGSTSTWVDSTTIPITTNWTFDTTYSELSLTASTTIPVWFKDTIYASSTMIMDGDLGTSLNRVPNAYFTNVITDTVQVDAYVKGNLDVSSGVLNIGGTSTTTIAGNGADSWFQGNVGIGTTEPGANLHIYDNDTSVLSQLTIEQDGTGDAAQYFYLTGGQEWTMGIDNSESDNFVIATGNHLGTPRVSITNDGNVGIGTTGPSEKLQVEGVVRLQNIDSGTWIKFLNIDSTFSFQAQNDKMVLNNDVGGGGDMVTFQKNGNVGIGTTDPEGTIDIIGPTQGTIKTYGSEIPGLILQQRLGTDGGPMLEFRTRNSADVWTTGAVVGIDSSGFGGQLAFLTQPGGSTDPTGRRTKGASLVEAMRIDQSGNVGIGTTSPKYKLDVEGNTRIYGDLTVTGNFSLPAQDILFVYATTTQAIANATWGAITYDVVGDVNGDMAFTAYMASTTIPHTADYLIEWDATADKTGGGNERIEVAVFVNNVVQPGCYSERNVINDSITGHFGFNCILDLTANDVVVVKAQANGGDCEFAKNGTAVTNASIVRWLIEKID